jgi:hypothetical protein
MQLKHIARRPLARPGSVPRRTHPGRRRNRRPGARQEAGGALWRRRPAGAHRLPGHARRTRPAARRQGTGRPMPGPTSPSAPVTPRSLSPRDRGSRRHPAIRSRTGTDPPLAPSRTGLDQGAPDPIRRCCSCPTALTNWRRRSPALLAQDKANLANNLMHINQHAGRHTATRKPYRSLVDRVATPYERPARGAFRDGPGSRRRRGQPCAPSAKPEGIAATPGLGNRRRRPRPAAGPRPRQTAIDEPDEFVGPQPGCPRCPPGPGPPADQ